MSTTFPTPEQKFVIELGGSALVVAGPGTGKTRTAVEKAKCSIAKLHNRSNQKILFLSFSNASVMRLAEAAKINLSALDKRAVKFQTYHSCAAEILKHYGRFIGLPPAIRIADKLEETLIVLEYGWELGTNQANNSFEQLAKTKGIVTFDWIIPLTNRLLIISPTLQQIYGQRYPIIIVDEFQDTSQSQWEFLQLLGRDSNVVVFGDPNQIIYESLHAATSKRIDDFKQWKGVTETPFTPYNFRCGSPKILEFAECMLKGSPFDATGNHDVVLFELNYRNELRSQLALIWKAIRDKVGKKETVGFLTPSNALSEEVSTSLREPPTKAMVKFPVYARIVPDEVAHDSVLLSLIAFRDYVLSNSDETLRKFALTLLAMQLAWKSKKKTDLNDVVKLSKTLEKMLSSKKSKLNILASQISAIRELNSLLPNFVDAFSEITGFEVTAKRIQAHGDLYVQSLCVSSQLALFDEVRSKRHPKGLSGGTSGIGLTQVLNFHKAKGREFDFVVMIVEPRKQSQQPGLEERRRLYYVCATRAKKWLGIIYYKNEIGDVLGPVLKPVKDISKNS